MIRTAIPVHWNNVFRWLIILTTKFLWFCYTCIGYHVETCDQRQRVNINIMHWFLYRNCVWASHGMECSLCKCSNWPKVAIIRALYEKRTGNVVSVVEVEIDEKYIFSSLLRLWCCLTYFVVRLWIVSFSCLHQWCFSPVYTTTY